MSDDNAIDEDKRDAREMCMNMDNEVEEERGGRDICDRSWVEGIKTVFLLDADRTITCSKIGTQDTRILQTIWLVGDVLGF